MLRRRGRPGGMARFSGTGADGPPRGFDHSCEKPVYDWRIRAQD
jgi:hypothetical protein